MDGAVDLGSALGELRSDPESFLRHYLVMIAGAAGNVSGGPQRFVMEDSGDRSAGFQTGLAKRLGRLKQRPKLRIRLVGGTEVVRSPQIGFEAWYVGMHALDDARAARHVWLSGMGGPDIALTPQMSGCSFGVGAANTSGDRFVSHIRPPAGVPTESTYRAMRQHGVREGARPETYGFFERGTGGGEQSYGNAANAASIVGVRSGGRWRFFAQIYNKADRTLFRVERLNG
jgi:hypothetical protein